MYEVIISLLPSYIWNCHCLLCSPPIGHICNISLSTMCFYMYLILEFLYRLGDHSSFPSWRIILSFVQLRLQSENLDLRLAWFISDLQKVIWYFKYMYIYWFSHAQNIVLVYANLLFPSLNSHSTKSWSFYIDI